MAGLDEDALFRQTVEARDQLGDLIGVQPRAFAYPNGSLDAAASRAVEAAGFEVAFAVHDDAGRHATSRVGIYSRDGRAAVTAKLFLAGERFEPLRHKLGRLRGRPAPVETPTRVPTPVPTGASVVSPVPAASPAPVSAETPPRVPTPRFPAPADTRTPPRVPAGRP